jgi:asparagine synthase (glutamine-hydrolysing)
VLLKVHLPSGEVLGGDAERLDLGSSGCLYVAGQYRLDNRQELCRRLDLPTAISDAELVGHAYLALGEERHCAALVGDFAYALFEVRRRRLLLVRDHLGVAPLYYHLSDDLCIVADSLDELLVQPEIPRDLDNDEGVIAEWCLNGRVHNQTDTFFDAIKKVPRATLLCVGARLPKTQLYWTVDDITPLRYTDERDYVEHLHHLLRTVVSDRLAHRGIQAAHFSGGLDSTPIAILAGRASRAQGRPFHTYNWCQPEADDAPECHEWTDARRVAQDEGFIHHETGLSVASLEQSLLNHDLARDGTTMFEYERLVLAQAAADGVTRIFSGFGGDELLTSRSRDHHTDAIRAGRFMHALRRLALESDPRRSLRLPRLGLDYARLLRRAWWPVPPERQDWHQQQVARLAARQSLLKLDFAAFAAAHHTPAGDYFRAECIAEKQRLMLDRGYHQERMESWAILGRRHGVRYVYPYLDKRLVEFAFALPAEWYYRRGRPRYLYTRALGDALPETLRTKSKLPESERVRQLVQRRHAALLSPSVSERVASADSDYIATDQVLAGLEALAGRDPADWQALIPEISALTDALLLLNAQAGAQGGAG